MGFASLSFSLSLSLSLSPPTVFLLPHICFGTPNNPAILHPICWVAFLLLYHFYQNQQVYFQLCWINKLIWHYDLASNRFVHREACLCIEWTSESRIDRTESHYPGWLQGKLFSHQVKHVLWKRPDEIEFEWNVPSLIYAVRLCRSDAFKRMALLQRRYSAKRPPCGCYHRSGALRDL